MKVEQIVATVQEWVEEHGRQLPGFCGAYLSGGIAGLPPDVSFPTYRDIDLIVVVEGNRWQTKENMEVFYKGLILELGFRGLNEHRSPDTILADPALAPNLAATTILADPAGVLAPLQSQVAEEFAHTRWIRGRCEAEKRFVTENLEQMSATVAIPDAFLGSLWFALNNISALIALAALEKPTHRRTLVQMKRLCQQQARADLHERALEVFGVAKLTRAQVQSFLNETATAFDRAVAVKHAPFHFDYKLQPYLRPYFIRGSQEMIDEGNHREATYWIAGAFFVANSALQLDGTENEKAWYRRRWLHLLEQLGLDTDHKREERFRATQALYEDVAGLADAIIERHHSSHDRARA